MGNATCKHNNHSHFLLWCFVWLTFMWNVMDCSGDSRMENRVSSLEHQVDSVNEQSEHEKRFLELKIKELQSELDTESYNRQYDVNQLKNKSQGTQYVPQNRR